MADDKKTGPLASEELEKDAQEGGTFLDTEDADGHTLPESERDRSKMKSGQHDEVTAAPTTIPPPD